MHNPCRGRNRVDYVQAQISLAPIPIFHTHAFEGGLNGLVAMRWLLEVVDYNLENGLDFPSALEPLEKKNQICAAQAILFELSFRTSLLRQTLNLNLWNRYILENILKLEVVNAALDPALADGLAATV